MQLFIQRFQKQINMSQLLCSCQQTSISIQQIKTTSSNRDILLHYLQTYKSNQYKLTDLSSENNIHLATQIPVQLLPEYSLLVQCKLNGVQLTVTVIILKNGLIWTVSNYIRARNLMEFANTISHLISFGTIKIDPINFSFSICLAQRLGESVFHGGPKNVFNHLTDQIRLATECGLFNIYHILYISGQTDDNIYMLAKEKLPQTRYFSKDIFFDLEAAVQLILKTTRNNKHLINNSRIRQFTTGQSLAKKINRFGQKFLHLKNTTFDSTDKDLKESIYQPNNKKLQALQILLKQEPFKKNILKYPNQRYDICSKIVFDSEQNGKPLKWEKLIEHSNSIISFAKAQFFYNESATDQQYQPHHNGDIKYVKPLIRKQNKGCLETCKERLHLASLAQRSRQEQKRLTFLQTLKLKCPAYIQTQHQKRVLNVLKAATSYHIPKFYQPYGNLSSKYQNSIILDYYAQGSAEQFFRNHQKVMSSKTRFQIAIHILQGMRFLRDIKIVHMDMKPQNVLIGRDLVARITDFGQSYIRQTNGHQHMTRKCSFPYVPPQFYLKNIVNSKRDAFDNQYDTYSFGVMLDFIFFRKHLLPWHGNNQKLREALYKSTYPQLMSISIEKYLNYFSPRISQILILMVILCMNPRSQMRPNQDILVIFLSLIKQVSDLQVFHLPPLPKRIF